MSSRDYGAEPTLTLLSWNVKSARHIAAQLREVMSEAPDIVALQEIAPAVLAQYRARLAALGLGQALDSFEPQRDQGVEQDPLRQRGILVASRWPLLPLQAFAVPWPERLLSLKVKAPFGDLDLHVAH